LFYNGTRSEAGKGLEISELAVIDVNYNTAYSVSAWQTPAVLSAGHTRTLNNFFRTADVCHHLCAIRRLTDIMPKIKKLSEPLIYKED